MKCRTEFLVFGALVVALLGLWPVQARAQDGSIVAWGYNLYGQCDVPSPNSDFVAISGGYRYTLGLKHDGSIVAFGDNTWGQCNVPSPNSDFVAVAAGYMHSLGLKSNGSVVAWGDNTNGQCNVPSPNTGFTGIAVSNYTSLGLKSDGTIVAWGDNSVGQCDIPSPNRDFVIVAAGHLHSLGLKRNGSIVAWGYNAGGQCNVPPPNTGFIDVEGGGSHTLGLKSDGSIVAWGCGYDNYGQCDVPSPNTGSTDVQGGGHHSLALKSDGTIVAWGRDQAGQCDVPSPNANFVAIGAGGWHSLGLHPYHQCRVAVIAPNGGERWPVGSQQTITWSRTDFCSDVVKIALLRRSPVRSSEVDIYPTCTTIADAAPNTGSYPWMVERCGIGADQYKVQITDVAAGASDRSDGSFSIPGGLQMAARPLAPEGMTLAVPFRPGSPIRFELRESGPVRVTVCDVLGRRIRTLVDGPLGVGDQGVLWDARTDRGEEAPSGIYYLGIKLGDRQMNSKIFLIR